LRETRRGCCPRRGGGRYSTERGNFAADSLHMKNHRLRMKPQVWLRSAKAEAMTREAVTRALDADPAALRGSVSSASWPPRRECLAQLTCGRCAAQPIS